MGPRSHMPMAVTGVSFGTMWDDFDGARAGTEQDAVSVYVVDDEPSVLQAMGRLFRAAGMRPVLSQSIRGLLDLGRPSANGCVVADIRLGEGSGLELPGLLRKRGWTLPVILVSADDTAATRAEARRAGAAALFRKPDDDQALVDMIRWTVRDARPERPSGID